MDYLAAHYADTLTERYKIEVEPGDTGYELLEKAGITVDRLDLSELNKGRGSVHCMTAFLKRDSN